MILSGLKLGLTAAYWRRSCRCVCSEDDWGGAILFHLLVNFIKHRWHWWYSWGSVLLYFGSKNSGVVLQDSVHFLWSELAWFVAYFVEIESNRSSSGDKSCIWRCSYYISKILRKQAWCSVIGRQLSNTLLHFLKCLCWLSIIAILLCYRFIKFSISFSFYLSRLHSIPCLF